MGVEIVICTLELARESLGVIDSSFLRYGIWFTHRTLKSVTYCCFGSECFVGVQIVVCILENESVKDVLVVIDSSSRYGN